MTTVTRVELEGAAGGVSPLGLPLVVQLGFAGARRLLDDPTLEGAVETRLVERLRRLPEELGLTDRHFFCGISQIAIGADTAFTRACATLQWPQRILLPQPVEDYLGAVGADGVPDFSEQQRSVARRLLGSDHIIQTRVVSEAPERTERFVDANLELVRVSDVLVCLVRASEGGKPGGTRSLIEHAGRLGRPLLVITMRVANGEPTFEDTWSNQQAFKLPALPAELAGLAPELSGIPSASAYFDRLRHFSGEVAARKQRLFKAAALVIIGTHVLATLIAAFALRVHGGILPGLLVLELALLLTGFATHRALHRSKAARSWAMSRLVAEIGRSLSTLVAKAYPSHLFSLPFPQELRSLLRTLNTLHLRSTRDLDDRWEDRRDHYLEARVDDQIGFYGRALATARRRSRLAQVVFGLGSALAIIAAATKLASTWLVTAPAAQEGLATWLGTAAIVLPVIAVAAVSLAASFDLDARIHTYLEMQEFLKTRREHLVQAESERAFAALALQTEARLLGENVNWYYRHAFAKVA